MSHNLDGKSNTEKDEHMHIGEGDYDFEFLLGCTKKGISKYETLETPRTKLDPLEEDLKNLEKRKKMTEIIKNHDYKSLLDRVPTLIEE